MNDSKSLLEIKNLTVTYSTSFGSIYALRDVSLQIHKGQVLGLAGESGSGKSTVGSALLGLFGPEANIESGSVMFQDRDLMFLSPQQRRKICGNQISAVFQDPFSSLNPSLSIGKQVAEPLIFHQGLSQSEAQMRVLALLTDVGIRRPEETILAFPHQLSGGMQQRILIATALACKPDLLILDEPTTALDVTIEAQILDLLEELCREKKLSILFISHNLGVVGRLCDVVCILYAGQVLEYGLTKQIFKNPQHPYTKGLMASMPTLAVKKDKTRLNFIPGSIPDLSRIHQGCIFKPRCPFGEKRCEKNEQKLVTLSTDHSVRCWKVETLLDTVWPHGQYTGTVSKTDFASTNQETQILVQTQSLSKDFRVGGVFSGLKFQFSGPGRIISYKPPKVTAVDQVSITIKAGEVLGLVGESGSGKTTLGRCLVRLLEPNSGRVMLENFDITHLSEKKLSSLRKKAQIIFQNPDSSLNPRKTVNQIVGRPIALFATTIGKSVKRRVEELLEMVNLSPSLFGGRYPHQLSGGEKQRVGIARALATSPRFIVCDEAVSALDVSVQAAIINLMEDLREEFNLTYLFISHDISVVAHLSKRIAVMYHGWICEIGEVEEVLSPPYHPYTEALLSAIPRMEDNMERSPIRLKGDPLDKAHGMNCCRFHPRCPRKIGPICEIEKPPVLEVSKNHQIGCHISLDDLKAMPSVISM